MRKKFAIICISILMAVSGMFAVSQTTFVAERTKAQTTNRSGSLINMSMRIPSDFPRHRGGEILKNTTNSAIGILPLSQEDKSGSRNPMKISPSGALIYGFLGYPSVSENIWSMDEVMSDGSSPVTLYNMTDYLGAAAIKDGKLIAYSQQFIWGMVSEFGFGEYDLTTGERLSYQVLNIQDLSNAVMTMAYNPDTEIIYAYTYSTDGESMNFCSININNPEHKTIIKENLSIPEVAISFTYSPKDGKYYGVNVQGIFAEVNVTTGELIEVIDTGLEQAGYITGLCYSVKDDAFIWNTNLYDDSSALYAIDIEEQSCTKLTDYNNYAQYNFLVTNDEVANSNSPRKALVEEISFEKGNLNGYITYQMPTETYSGEAISGELKYHSFVDGNLHEEGTAEAGETVTINYSDLEQGNRTFSLIVSDNSGLESPTTLTTAYVGYDNPKAPTNVKFNQEGISWDAVTDNTGRNGGYVDVEDMKYDVYVDNKKIATTTDTFVAYTITDGTISSHIAEVVAISHNLESHPGTSNKYIAGDALDLPLNIEPTEEDIELCTIIDNNNDGFTWFPRYIDTYYVFSYSYSSQNTADDWLILPPFRCEDTEYAYNVSAESAVAINGYPESYEIYYGTSPEPEAMTKIFLKEGIDNTSWKKDNALFTIKEAGIYYVAIRCVSPADRFDLRIRNIKVEKSEVSTSSPDVPTQIESVAAEGGLLKATISFNMPTTTINGEPLKADLQLEATVKTLADRQTITGIPGSSQSVEIKTSQGDNQVAIQISDGENNSPVAYTNVYTGSDIPSAPENFKGELSEDNMTVHLSWDAPTEGANGGYVKPNGEDMTYNIVLYSEYDGWYIDTSIPSFSETSYDYVVPEEVGLIDLAIGVVASNEAGQGRSFAYGSFIAGKPYELPMIDYFTSGDFIYNPLTTWSDNLSVVKWSAFNPANLGEEYANRSDIALIGEATTDNSYARLSLPKFSTEFATNPYVSFYLYCGSATVDIYAEAYGIEATKIGSTSDINTIGWEDIKIQLPKEFVGKKWVTIYLDAYIPTAGQYVMFGGYSFKDYLANDMAITSINAPSMVKIGDTMKVIVNSENYGYEAIAYPATKVEIFKEGKLIETIYGEIANTTIESDEKISQTFEIIVSADLAGEIEIVASIINSDMNDSNNSKSKTISVERGNAVVVTDLNARLDAEGNVELYWTEPELKSGFESFEDYAAWSYGPSIGDFKCVDVDGYHQYSIAGLPIPDVESPKAFQVYDISSFGDAYVDVFPASDGKKYIAAFCPYEPDGNIAPADDWLISPELKPGSTFSFDMDIFTESYGEEVVEILTSNSTDNIDNFIILDTIKKGTTGWETFTYTLPEDAKYIALRYISKDIFGIMIDNINYTNVYGDATISGYDIYRNNELIAENATVHGVYVDTTVTEPNADYTYNVVPLYNGNRGLMSNSVTINPSGIGNIFIENMIYGSKGEIIINGFANKAINILSVDGKRIATVKENNNNIRFNVQPGIYIVNIERINAKVFVR